MKTILLICGILAAPMALNAQTNATAEPASSLHSLSNAPAATVTNLSADTNAPSHLPDQTEISSDSGSFNMAARIAVYVDNVVVLNPQMKLTCGILTAHIPESGKIDSIVAERDVVIEAKDKQGRPFHATCGKAVYTYRILNSVTNETIELTRDPVVSSAMFNGTATSIVWDNLNDTVSYTGEHMIFKQQAGGHTNSLPFVTPNKK